MAINKRAKNGRKVSFLISFDGKNFFGVSSFSVLRETCL